MNGADILIYGVLISAVGYTVWPALEAVARWSLRRPRAWTIDRPPATHDLTSDWRKPTRTTTRRRK